MGHKGSPSVVIHGADLDAIPSERVRAGRSGNRRPRGAGSPLRRAWAGSGRGRCPDRRLRPGRSQSRGPAFGVLRHQDLHRRAEGGPAAVGAGRRHRLPHDGDVPRLWLQRARAEGGLLDQRDDILEAESGEARHHRSQRQGPGCRGRAVGVSACRSESGARARFLPRRHAAIAGQARAPLCAAPARRSHRRWSALRGPRGDGDPRAARPVAREAGRDGQGPLPGRLRRGAQHRAQGDRPRASRRFRPTTPGASWMCWPSPIFPIFVSSH